MIIRMLLCCMALLATGAAAAASTTTSTTTTDGWRPATGVQQIPIWPGTPPDEQAMPGKETVTVSHGTIGGKTATAVTNVARPTLTLYPARGHRTGTAVIVLPGGGFQILAMDLEGTEACDWLTARGVACILLKYRVPSPPYDWHCDCRPHNHQVPTQALEDLQRTLSLVRFNARAWRIDPHKIGVMGFSAGGFLVAEASTRYAHRLYRPVDAADKENLRPDFAVPIYPGHLAEHGHLNPNVPVTHDTPPTFLVQAEDDYVDGVQQALVYYTALAQAHVPAEMHLYAHGGHAFGLRRTGNPITTWPALFETWLRTQHMLPPAAAPAAAP